MKIIAAEGTIAGLVEEGAGVDRQLKQLGGRDKEIKKSINDFVATIIGDENGVKLTGPTAAAQVSKRRDYCLNQAHAVFQSLRPKIDAGILGTAIQSSVQYHIAADRWSAVAEALKKAGLGDAIVVSREYSLDAKQWRDLCANDQRSVEALEVREALKPCIACAESFAVKYERPA